MIFAQFVDPARDSWCRCVLWTRWTPAWFLLWDLLRRVLQNPLLSDICVGVEWTEQTSDLWIWLLPPRKLPSQFLSEISCDYLAAALKSNPSYPRALDLSVDYNNLQDSGVKQLCVLLENPRCRFETLRLSHCDLSERSCEALSSGLSSQTSNLRHLDLSNINLKDSGVKLLAEGLKSPHCTLETLSLSGCLITEEGCTSLASALSSNPSHLRELDLSYNQPGDSGMKLLLTGLKDPGWRLDTLSSSLAMLSFCSDALSSYSGQKPQSLFRTVIFNFIDVFLALLQGLLQLCCPAVLTGFLLIGAGLALAYRRIKEAEPAVQPPPRLPAGIETMGRGGTSQKGLTECSMVKSLEALTAAVNTQNKTSERTLDYIKEKSTQNNTTERNLDHILEQLTAFVRSQNLLFEQKNDKTTERKVNNIMEKLAALQREIERPVLEC
ncbi:unnamed protein product [Oreochromis niloticus]|nr:unnamed protein product [Mustela putorius furo]